MNFELIKYTENLPFKISFFDAQYYEYHWHKEIELIFILKGNVEFNVKGEIYKVSERDLFLINSFNIHSISSKSNGSLILILHLEPIFFDKFCSNFSELCFDSNSLMGDRDNFLYEKISSNLAKIVLSIIKQNPGYKLKSISSVTEIALLLVENLNPKVLDHKDKEIYKQIRISQLVKYIDQNYANEISLSILSNKMLLNPQYISTFFKSNLGISFVDYVNKIRITKSINDLLESRKSILDISIEYGFNDHKAYNRVFKREFNMTPTEYRKKYAKTSNIENTLKESIYFDDNSSNYLKYLFEFLHNDQNIANNDINSSDKLHINVNVIHSQGKNLIKYWNKIISVGRAALCLRGEIQNQIRTVQKDIGYEFITFHGIFSDEMMVYKEDSNGNAVYDWSFIDEIFDFFREVNIKPFVEIGFMPEDLASKKQYASFLWRPNVSYPKSIQKWKTLIGEFLNHYIQRYGKEEVEKWYFEVWCSPDIPDVYWFESKDSFFKFYKETYFAMKKVSNNLKIGSPSVSPYNNFKWFSDFLNYCKDNSIELDFVTSHIYSHVDATNESFLGEFLSIQTPKFSLADENFLHRSVVSMKQILNESHLNDTKLFLTSWNLNLYAKDYTRDTCFLSSYILYNVLNNIDNIDGLAYWSLSDILEEKITENKIFHGGPGLFTRNGLKKPSFNAFFLLNKLGNNVIERGRDYIITSKDKNIQILIYNFVYLDELFRSGDKSLLSYHNRYNVYKPAKNKSVDLLLTLETGNYSIKRSRLTRDSGSSFDAWLKMGAPENISPDIYAFLKSRESPEISITTQSVKEQLLLSDSVSIHGVLLIEIDRLD